MGRPERPVDPADGPVAAFAADLRALRDSAGAPSYRTLAQRAHYSVSTLSQAAAGRILPSLPVMRAFVAACGGDPAEWEQKWQAVSRTAGTAAGGNEGPPATRGELGTLGEPAQQPQPPVTEVIPSRGPHRRRLLVLSAAITGLTVAGISAAAWAHFKPTHAGAPAAGAAAPVIDGSDPTRAGCGPDAETLAATRVHFPVPDLAGSLELRYSPHCRAAWSRFEPADGWAPGRGVVVTVWTIRPADQATSAYTVPYGGEAIIGNILMTAKGCIAAELSIKRGPDTSPTATTACVAL